MTADVILGGLKPWADEDDWEWKGGWLGDLAGYEGYRCSGVLLPVPHAGSALRNWRRRRTSNFQRSTSNVHRREDSWREHFAKLVWLCSGVLLRIETIRAPTEGSRDGLRQNAGVNPDLVVRGPAACVKGEAEFF